MKGAITISRDSNNVIRIRLRDESSFIRFAELRMTPADFSMALTGLSDVEGELEVWGLDLVGKYVEVQRRSIACPLQTYDRKELSAWLIEHAAEDGWVIDPYLGVQGSVIQKDGVTTLNYSARRYMDAPP